MSIELDELVTQIESALVKRFGLEAETSVSVKEGYLEFKSGSLRYLRMGGYDPETYIGEMDPTELRRALNALKARLDAQSSLHPPGVLRQDRR